MEGIQTLQGIKYYYLTRKPGYILYDNSKRASWFVIKCPVRLQLIRQPKSED